MPLPFELRYSNLRWHHWATPSKQLSLQSIEFFIHSFTIHSFTLSDNVAIPVKTLLSQKPSLFFFYKSPVSYSNFCA